MEKTFKKEAVRKVINMASLTVLVFVMTLAGVIIGPKVSLANGVVGPCPDFNFDTRVNLSDFAYLGKIYQIPASYDIKADFDQDGDIDEFDKFIFAIYYNTDFTCGNYIPNLATICPDYNNDGVVNLSDFTQFNVYKASNIPLADFDGDGDVDDFDTAIFGAYYNTNYICPIKESKIVSTPTPEQICFPNFIASAEYPNMVNLSDFAAFSEHFNSKEGDGRYDSFYDADKNGKIEEFDKLVFEVFYNKSFTCGSSVIPAFTRICPDYNHDGVVDLSDFSYFSTYKISNSREADFDGDGDVDEFDAAIFGAYYNTNYVCPSLGIMESEIVSVPILASVNNQASSDNSTADVKDKPVKLAGANPVSAVLGAETTGEVAGAEDEALPKAGIDIASYLIVLVGLSGLAIILKK